MSFAARKKPMKVPSSMGEVVAQMVMLKSTVRLRKDDHILVSEVPTHRLTYFIAGSSHPQNLRTVHITPTMAVDATRKQRLLAGCSLLFYKGKSLMAERNYTLGDYDRCVADLLAYMDAGDMQSTPPPLNNSKEGVQTT